jgi:hypothetical protein
MWTVGRSEPNNQANAVFETTDELAEALARMAVLQRENRNSYVWANAGCYDSVARLDDEEIGFVIHPTTGNDSEPPALCLPYNAEEMLELVATGTATVAADDDRPTWEERRRGRMSSPYEVGILWVSACGPNVSHSGATY